MTTTVLERTIELVPELRARAEQANADRRLPEENIKALRQAGSFKVLQSSRNGGLGLGVRDHLDVISTLARGCASTAWVAGVVHAHSWLLSHFPAEGQDDVYGDDPDAVVSAVIGPRGRAVKTADGFRLEGVWPFASGSERADWLLLGAVVVDGDTSCRRGRLHRPDVGRHVPRRLVRHRPAGDGVVHGEGRRARHPRPSLLVVARSDHGQQPGRCACTRTGCSGARRFRCSRSP